MAVDKLVDSSRLDAALTATADAIREKTGDDNPVTFDPDTGFADAVESIEGGGSAEIDVFLRDYDGTLVYGYTKDQFLALNALPTQPTHQGMIAQGWNWNLEEAQTYVGKYGGLEIGAIYITETGATEFDIELDNPELLSPNLYLYVSGVFEIDWGDGSPKQTVESSSYEINEQHTYASTGEYTISVKPTGENDWIEFTSNYSNDAKILLANRDDTKNFYYTNSIKRIRLGRGYDLYNYAFSFMNLESISIADNEWEDIHCGAFCNCDIDYVALPNGCSLIDDEAFSSSLIKRISIPNTVKSIGENAFGYSYLLEFISLPESIDFIDDDAFYFSGVEKALLGGTSEIGENLFANCGRLKYVDASNLELVNECAFDECASIETVILGNNLTTIEDTGFADCYALKDIRLPDSVTTMHRNALAYCFSLKDITMPRNISSLESGAFYCCENLETVRFPEDTTYGSVYVGPNTFGACYKLNDINLPEGTATIDEHAFSNCYSLGVLDIPASITEIGANAFEGSAVLALHIRGTTPPVARGPIGLQKNDTLKIYVPRSADHSVLNAYKTATNWSVYADYIYEEPETDE